eukprot:5964375-Prymnesium_polylepis.1
MRSDSREVLTRYESNDTLWRKSPRDSVGDSFTRYKRSSSGDSRYDVLNPEDSDSSHSACASVAQRQLQRQLLARVSSEASPSSGDDLLGGGESPPGSRYAHRQDRPPGAVRPASSPKGRTPSSDRTQGPHGRVCALRAAPFRV